MKTTIKSLWAFYKDEQKMLNELRGLPATDVLLSKWADYALANDLSQVFKWVYGQLNSVHRTSPRLLKQACVYNRVDVVAFLLTQQPSVSTDDALMLAAGRGYTQVVDMLYNHSICHNFYQEASANPTRLVVAKAACEGRQLALLSHYIPFPMDLEERSLTTLMRVCAEKNFTDGLAHLLQWAIPSEQWDRVASGCIQPYALQSECMLFLINNVPEGTSVLTVKRTVGDALQRLFTLNSIAQLHTHHRATLKVLVPFLSFDEFCARNSSMNVVRNNREALQEIWICVENLLQRNEILQHLPVREDNSIKRKM